MDKQALEQALRPLPLVDFFTVSPEELEFSQRVRWVCAHECPRYGKSWACPPGVGTVEQCRDRCLRYRSCLVIGTAAEVSSVSNMAEALATRPAHEAVTDQVGDILRSLGCFPYILSSESCCQCSQCAYPAPCVHPERMHPCVESHGINLIPLLEKRGIPFLNDENTVTWFSLLFY